MNKFVDVKILSTVILGVIAVGLIFNYMGDLPVVSDARKSFG